MFTISIFETIINHYCLNVLSAINTIEKSFLFYFSFHSLNSMSCFHILGIPVDWKHITVIDLCMLLRDVHFRKSCTIPIFYYCFYLVCKQINNCFLCPKIFFTLAENSVF